MSDEMDALDELLKSAMIARPEHLPMLDVAAVAMMRVRTQQERVARLARIAWWTRLSGVAAGILIAIIAAAGYWLWPASTSSTATTDLADTTSTLTTTSTIDMTTLGIAAFVVTLIAVTMLTLMTPERPTLRLTSA